MMSRIFTEPIGLSAGALRRGGILSVAVLLIVLGILYWGLIASDRYVSEAHVVVDRTDLSSTQTMDFSSLLSGGKGSHDISILRDHLLSVDMLQKLDARFNLRAHYSGQNRDIISRMWFVDGPMEWFHNHYLSRVNIYVDELTGVLHIIAQAYTPEMAHSIALFLVEEGERFMNDMAHRLANEQVSFLEVQVSQISERLLATRKAVVDFQNDKGLVSPQSTAQSLTSIVASLEGQLTETKTRRQAMLGYLNPNVPDVAQLNLQIGALEKQLAVEQARLASTEGKTLNWTVEEYQRLQMESEFVQDVYRTALVALEKGRVEATRTLKKLSILQSPTHPQYPLEPRSIYNIVAFSLAVLISAGILRLLTAIIRDHKD